VTDIYYFPHTIILCVRVSSVLHRRNHTWSCR